MLFKRKVHCAKCGEDWGVTIVIDEKEWITLKVKSFVLEYTNGKKHMHKQWKDVLFKVPKITPEEEEEEEDEK